MMTFERNLSRQVWEWMVVSENFLSTRWLRRWPAVFLLEGRAHAQLDRELISPSRMWRDPGVC